VLAVHEVMSLDCFWSLAAEQSILVANFFLGQIVEPELQELFNLSLNSLSLVFPTPFFE